LFWSTNINCFWIGKPDKRKSDGRKPDGRPRQRGGDGPAEGEHFVRRRGATGLTGCCRGRLGEFFYLRVIYDGKDPNS
jgi:hypothetical protein